MTYTVDELIKNAVKYPVRRVYFQFRDTDGNYTGTWVRMDNIDGVNRVIKHGKVTIKIDADKVNINSYDISTYSMQFMNQDGCFNSNADYRSCFFDYLDHKDTKIKIVVALKDPDGVEVGTITAFEGLIVDIDSKGDNTAPLKAVDYTKKLKEYPFSDLDLVGNKTITEILTAIFADTRVAGFFSTTTLTPVQDVTIDIATNDVFKKTMWDVIKFCAEKSQSTIFPFNETFYFGTREVIGTTPLFTFAGLGNLQNDRSITIYGKPSYDQSGADKLYTSIIDSSTNLIAQSTDPILLDTGKTKTLDLSDVTTSAEKQDILDSYLSRWGQRRPALKFKSPFMMFTLFPLDIIAVDSPGSKTEVNSGYYDSSIYDDGSVWDGDGSSASISGADRFVLESITYDVQKWETKVFCRKLI